MSRTVTRVVLVILGIPALVLGVWAVIAPESFFTDFPGFGRAWVVVDGPYNEHLVRDVGALNLALVTVTAVAAVTLRRAVVVVTSLAWIVWSVPHLAYHIDNADLLPSADRAPALAGIGLGIVLAGLLLWLPVPGGTETTDASAPSTS